MLQIKPNDIQVLTDLPVEGLSINVEGENAAHLFNILINMYSNPIRACVQELCSNARDASHVFTCGIENGMFYVQDYGEGMSPEFFRDVFLRVLTSTKRGDQNKIGYIGIGSKSPLAYTSMYNIITIWEGIEYTYSIFKDSDFPKVVLQSSIPTEHKGTRVLVPIKSSDTWIWQREIKDVTEFFDGAIVNDKKIEITEYEGYKVGTELGLLLGPVKYDIDWQFFREYDYLMYVPLRIDLELTGEVGPSPSRESLIFNDRAIQYIKAKLEILRENVGEWSLVDMNLAQYASYLSSNYVNVSILDKKITLTNYSKNFPKQHQLIKDNIPEKYKDVLENHLQSLLHYLAGHHIKHLLKNYSSKKYYIEGTFRGVDRRLLSGNATVVRLEVEEFSPEVNEEIKQHLILTKGYIKYEPEEVDGEVVVKIEDKVWRKGSTTLDEFLAEKRKGIYVACVPKYMDPLFKRLLPCCGINLVKFNSKRDKKVGLFMSNLIDIDELTGSQKNIIKRLMRKAVLLKSKESISFLSARLSNYKSVIQQVDPELYSSLEKVLSTSSEDFSYSEIDEVINLGKKLGFQVPSVYIHTDKIEKYLGAIEALYLNMRYGDTDRGLEVFKVYYDLSKRKSFIYKKSTELGYDSNSETYVVCDDTDSILLERSESPRMGAV